MDGESAVVVTNSGGVRFYPLIDGDNNEWGKVDCFPNINRSPMMAPAVSLSGKLAVVGFSYQVLGFDQGTSGAYVRNTAPRVDGSGWMY